MFMITLSLFSSGWCDSNARYWSVCVNFQKIMIPFWKHRDQGRHLRQVSEEDLSVEIQLPPAEDGDGYHRNIRIKM